MVPPSALWLPIAISSPQWVATQAAQVWLYNVPPEKQNNGVKDPVYSPDKTNVPSLNASSPILLVGTHVLACCVLNVFRNCEIVAHFVCACFCGRQQIWSIHLVTLRVEKVTESVLCVSNVATEIKLVCFNLSFGRHFVMIVELTWFDFGTGELRCSDILDRALIVVFVSVQQWVCVQSGCRVRAGCSGGIAEGAPMSIQEGCTYILLLSLIIYVRHGQYCTITNINNIKL